MRFGIYASLGLLVLCLAVAFWPVLQTKYFWLSAGIIAGMVGTLIFSIANENTKDGNH